MNIKIKKYLAGGGLVASIYLPTITTSGAQAASNSAQLAINLLNGASGSGKSSKSDKGEITEKDLYTGLYKTIAESGLLSDSQYIIKQLLKDMFNDSLLDPFGDNSDLTTLYLKALLYANLAKSNLKYYDETYKRAVEKNNLAEPAITSTGQVIVKNEEGIKPISIEEYKKNLNKYILMTNGNLLAERMNRKPFENGLLEIVQGGTSMQEISEIVKAFTEGLGTLDSTIGKLTDDKTVQDGIDALKTLVAKNGLETVMSAIKSGSLYKLEITSKSNFLNILEALNAIYNSLNVPLKALLELHGGKATLVSILSAKAKDTFNFDLDDSDSSKSSSSSGKGVAELNDAEILLAGSNDPTPLTFGYGNSAFLAAGRKATISNYLGEAMGADFSYLDLYKSLVASVLDLDNASFGDMPINKAYKERIIVDNSDIYGVDLPYTTDDNGRIIPDFALLGKIRQIDNEILKQGLSPENPNDIAKINKLYTDAALPIKYKIGPDGRIDLTGNYKRFAAIQATADELALLGNFSISDSTFEIVDDDVEIKKFIESMKKATGDKHYSLDKPWWFTGDRHIVKGTIFIPITGSMIDARKASSKGKITGGSTDYDTIRASWNAKSNYIAPTNVNTTQ